MRAQYNKVINIPNSMTVLPELIPLSIEMAKRKLTGVMNYTNPGAISHNEILELYKQYIDPDFSWCARRFTSSLILSRSFSSHMRLPLRTLLVRACARVLGGDRQRRLGIAQMSCAAQRKSALE